MPRMSSVCSRSRNFQFLTVAERLRIDLGVTGALLYESFEFTQLMNSDGRLNVTPIVLKPIFLDLVIPASSLAVAIPRVLADSVQRKQLDPAREGFGIGCDHPTLAGGHVFCGIKTERHGIARETRSADVLAAIERSCRVRRILDHEQLVFLGKVP